MGRIWKDKKKFTCCIQCMYVYIIRCSFSRVRWFTKRSNGGEWIAVGGRIWWKKKIIKKKNGVVDDTQRQSSFERAGTTIRIIYIYVFTSLNLSSTYYVHNIPIAIIMYVYINAHTSVCAFIYTSAMHL